jgi:hypothetical protein
MADRPLPQEEALSTSARIGPLDWGIDRGKRSFVNPSKV